MIIYPAIDIRGGKVVRLREGDPSQQTTFGNDPVRVAQRWLDAGAEWIHMVNLDGAFDEDNTTLTILKSVAALGVKVQFGGGLRSLDAIEQALSYRASRVVLGTIAIQQPDVVATAISTFGSEAICVGLDALDGRITTHGWQQVTNHTPAAIGKAMAGIGVQHALFTDVSRDGKLQGANIEATIDLAKTTKLSVIASGGIRDLDEIRRLRESQIVAGTIIGMALYEGKIQLADAIAIAEEGM